MINETKRYSVSKKNIRNKMYCKSVQNAAAVKNDRLVLININLNLHKLLKLQENLSHHYKPVILKLCAAAH